MRCEMCGSYLEPGEHICKYCGYENDITDLPELDDLAKSAAAEESVLRGGSDAVTDELRRKRFCVKCGRETDPVTHKCPVCDAERRMAQRAAAPKEELTEQPEESNKKPKTTMIIALSVIGTLVVFAITFIVFFKALRGPVKNIDHFATESAVTTEAPTEEPSDKPTEAPKPTAKPIQTAKPTQKPTPKPTPKPVPTEAPTPEPKPTATPEEHEAQTEEPDMIIPE